MGWGDLVGEAVSGAEGDMNAVQAAADAISTAMASVTPWLTPETWDGAAASAWVGEWMSFYQGVQSCLSSLPAAEADIISSVRTQMMQVEQRAHQAATA